jgi:3-oxoacyl-[acyl-carrier protein] reductase
VEDTYLNLMRWSVSKTIAKRLGLPQPVPLDRYCEGNDWLIGNTLIGSTKGAVFAQPILELTQGSTETVFAEQDSVGSHKLKTVIFDASGISNAHESVALCQFFSKHLRSLGACARIVVVGLIPESCPPTQHSAQRSLLGFTKSLAKEMRHGGTVNLLWCDAECGSSMYAPLAFFASDRSAYVSGQALTVRPCAIDDFNFTQPLKDNNILVTGAARGIGRAIADLLKRRGATVALLDVPESEGELKKLAAELSGTYLCLDITSDTACQRIQEHYGDRPLHGIVHNAGITRDKKLANMTDDRWMQVIEVNWACQEQINQRLIEQGTLKSGGRIVLVSSISGIAGNAGQTNYATSKAAVIGMVDAHAAQAMERGITINAVAPGFIETQMVESIPLALREAGRRLNSMAQGGQPVDVAEAVALFLQSSAQGLNGNVLRVCGQALMGA